MWLGDSRQPGFQTSLVIGQFGGGEFLAEQVEQCGPAVGKLYRADADFGSGENQPSQRRLDGGVANGNAGSTVPVT